MLQVRCDPGSPDVSGLELLSLDSSVLLRRWSALAPDPGAHGTSARPQPRYLSARTPTGRGSTRLSLVSTKAWDLHLLRAGSVPWDRQEASPCGQQDGLYVRISLHVAYSVLLGIPGRVIGERRGHAPPGPGDNAEAEAARAQTSAPGYGTGFTVWLLFPPRQTDHPGGLQTFHVCPKGESIRLVQARPSCSPRAQAARGGLECSPTQARKLS